MNEQATPVSQIEILLQEAKGNKEVIKRLETVVKFARALDKKSKLLKKKGVLEIFLTGSTLKFTAGEGSDIDILIIYQPSDRGIYWDQYLEKVKLEKFIIKIAQQIGIEAVLAPKKTKGGLQITVGFEHETDLTGIKLPIWSSS